MQTDRLLTETSFQVEKIQNTQNSYFMIIWFIKMENKHCVDVKPFHLIKLQAAVHIWSMFWSDASQISYLEVKNEIASITRKC